MLRRSTSERMRSTVVGDAPQVRESLMLNRSVVGEVAVGEAPLNGRSPRKPGVR
jgi:hypothetical protein